MAEPPIRPPGKPWSETPTSPPDRRRRRLFVALVPGLAGLGKAHALSPTPRQSEGPFYPRRLPQDRDADLTLFGGQRAPGEVIEIAGRVFGANGAPIAGALVEIWHCDERGVYAHVGQPTHPAFQGYGAVRTGQDGAYRFRTTRPGLYPGRTRHVHVKAARPGAAALATQMYFPGETGNDRDFLLRRAADPALLIAQELPGPPPRYIFDIVLD